MPEPRFTFNAKSLTLGRVLIGTLVLVDLRVRAEALEAHYSDLGALPRDAYTLSQWDQLWSLHLLSGETVFASLLFAVTAAALIGFVIGWKTRLMNAIAFVLYVSLCARNPLLRDGQDELGRVILFFCLFLPLDASRAPAPQVRGPGTLAFTLQVCFLYWASVVHKLQSPWWTSGHAIENVVQMRRYQTPFAQWAQQYPEALQGFTWASLVLEALGPLALLVFWHRPRVRLLVIAAMISLHVGMWLNIRIGTFPPLCAAVWLMFLPSAFWGGLVEAPKNELPRWAGRVALAAIVLVAWLNVRNLLHLRVPEAVDVPPRLLGLQQWWGVFAPTRSEGVVTDGWFWAQGRTEGGELVTVDTPWFTSSQEPPALLRFQSVRWRHLLANLSTFSWPQGSQQARTQVKAREAMTRWMCREWNKTHPEQRLSQLYVFFFRHELGKPTPATRELLASGDDACTAP